MLTILLMRVVFYHPILNVNAIAVQNPNKIKALRKKSPNF